MGWTIACSGALGAMVIGAACGGDAADPLSKAEFVTEADAICQDAQDEMTPIFDAVWAGLEDVDQAELAADETLVFARWEEALVELTPILQRNIDDIRALAPPTEDEEVIATLLDDQEAAMTEFTALIEAAADGDRSAMARLEADDPFVEVDRRAREYGLTVCGQDAG